MGLKIRKVSSVKLRWATLRGANASLVASVKRRIHWKRFRTTLSEVRAASV
ncbi:hypothetical protein GXM_02536 [Nostoc sphaeroides CCNUC1]|uniref:Uncharacterized protein n=1 Tax=Nostoc sphaeroides CCNUC1 TaxID=2653204 RepID=A0A5P8VXL3_9NOSO|nr:hypothetical protein GXM_02536 [Nostoc sphaeroides CCNUC1]